MTVDMYIGMIIPWAVNFTPQGFMPCDGRTLNVKSYDALFSIIGNKYGGDGSNTFMLPDLRGQVPVGVGENHALGHKGGITSVKLDIMDMEPHTHGQIGGSTIYTGQVPAMTIETSFPATTDYGSKATAAYNTRLAQVNDYSVVGEQGYLYAEKDGTAAIHMQAILAEDTPISATVPYPAQQLPTGNKGSGMPHNNMQPYIALEYIICMSGIYPPFTNE